MTVALRGPATGSTLSDHDSLYAYAAEMVHNGTLTSNAGADVGMPRITLADAATQRMKWTWAIPVRWDAIRVNFGMTNETAGAGNVRWQFAYKMIYLGEGNIDGAVTATINATLTAGGQFDHTYHEMSASILTPVGAFGDAPFMMCALSRIGADGADTLAGAASVHVITCTRIDI